MFEVSYFQEAKLLIDAIDYLLVKHPEFEENRLEARNKFNYVERWD